MIEFLQDLHNILDTKKSQISKDPILTYIFNYFGFLVNNAIK